MSEQILDQMERELPLLGLTDEQTCPLFHYTTPAGCEGILRERTIRLTHYLHMNDRNELTRGEELVDEAAELLKKEELPKPAAEVAQGFARAHLERRFSKVADAYVASFSEDGDMLSQWRAYANDGRGYAIGFDALPVPKDPNPNASLGVQLVRVEYDPDRGRAIVLGELRRIVLGLQKYFDTYANESNFRRLLARATTLMLQQAAGLVPRLKHDTFVEEHEWRLVAIAMPKAPENPLKIRAANRGLVPYVEISLDINGRVPISRLHLGPRLDEQSGPVGAGLALAALGYENVAIERSRIPYRG